jgi:hypothetical protein
VQNTGRLAAFLYAVHGGRPRVLREDFCGSGGVCRAWAGLGARHRGGGRFRAVGVDLDAEPLSRLRGAAGVRAVRADVMDCPARADIISATNFPIGYLWTRRDLMRYLRRSRERLRMGGVFVCDTYGGATAFTTGTLLRDVWTDDGVRIRYMWEQREADPLTGMVTDVLHFRADRAGDVVYEEADAFVYRWRLWPLAELREAMAEAGFRSSEVHVQLADAVDSDGQVYVKPVEGPSELSKSFVVLIAARTA